MCGYIRGDTRSLDYSSHGFWTAGRRAPELFDATFDELDLPHRRDGPKLGRVQGLGFRVLGLNYLLDYIVEY